MSAQRFYDLLPAIHRLRDAQSGRVLEALLEVMQHKADLLADDLEDMYDDWFVETCRDWVVPYIGELVSARDHYAFGPGALDLRAFVADTLNFRRRKGTASMLEDLALAVTGWTCRSLELFAHVVTSQHVNHVRASAHATISIRDSAPLERLGGPFDASQRLCDVRSIAGGRARANLPNVALFLWRLEALPATDGAAVSDLAAGAGRFRFDPLGSDRTLFAPARTLDERAQSVDESDVPAPARRRALYDELVRARAALAAGGLPHYRYFAAGSELLAIVPAGESAPIPAEQIQICNLDQWATLPAAISVTRPDGSSFSTRVAVDPRSGRLAFLGASPPASARVQYYYGAAAAIGATHHAREPQAATPADVTVTVAVADWTQPSSPALGNALAAWVAAGQPDRVIEIADSGRYALGASCSVPAGRRLVLRARSGERPVILLGASWPITLGAGATLALEGLFMLGATIVVRGQAAGGLSAQLELRHATLVPGLGQDADGTPSSPGAVVLRSDAASSGTLAVRIERSITGRIDLTPGGQGFGSDVHVSDSIVDDASDPSEALRAHDLHVERATVLGATIARTLEASDTIFTGRLEIERTQHGCVRFSYVPEGSKVPRAYRCQPALALAAPGADAALIAARLRPAFTSTRFGEGAYLQLAGDCPREIAEGGSDGSEMGAYFHLHQPQREANLRRGLQEYLRFGLEAGLVFVT